MKNKASIGSRTGTVLSRSTVAELAVPAVPVFLCVTSVVVVVDSECLLELPFAEDKDAATILTPMGHHVSTVPAVPASSFVQSTVELRLPPPQTLASNT